MFKNILVACALFLGLAAVSQTAEAGPYYHGGCHSYPYNWGHHYPYGVHYGNSYWNHPSLYDYQPGYLSRYRVRTHHFHWYNH